MNFRFESYCENCDAVRPVAIKNLSRDPKTGMRVGAKMTIACSHAPVCKRIWQNIKADIKAAEKVQNCSDEDPCKECGDQTGGENCGFAPICKNFVPLIEAAMGENCTDEASES